MVSHTSDYHPTKDLTGLNIFKTFSPRYVNCPTVQPNKLHDREMLAIDAINDDLKKNNLETFTPIWERSQDYVRLCAEDPKNKLLFLSAEYDPHGSANPKTIHRLSSLADKFDFQYKLISSYEEMCKVIDAASKIGNLVHIIIEGQMTNEGLIISNKERFTLKNRDIKFCFSGLNPSGSVTLFSNSDYQQSFSHELSDIIHRFVREQINNVPETIKLLPSFDPS